MSEEKLKQELLYMVKLASKYDFKNSVVVNEIKSAEEERQILTSVFGQRFLSRIEEISQNKAESRKCVICGRLIAVNGVICQSCMDRIGNSEYAKHANSDSKEIQEPNDDTNKIKIKRKWEKPVFKVELSFIKRFLSLILEKVTSINDILKKFKTNKIGKNKSNTEDIDEIAVSSISDMAEAIIGEADENLEYYVEEDFDFNLKKKPNKVKHFFKDLLTSEGFLAVLVLLLIFNVSALYMLNSNKEPDVEKNPIEEATVSNYSPVPVNSIEEAAVLVQEEYPEEVGWSVFEKEERDFFVGSFNVDVGQNVSEVEENLTSEEKYNFYFQEKGYVFFVSYNDGISGKVGMVCVNSDGKILVQGVFNNGRVTDAFYRIR